MAALKSRLGRANWKGVWGWALDAGSLGSKVTIEIVLDGQVIGRVVADDPRPNMKHIPPEQRNCGFQFLFPNGLSALSRHVVHARYADDGTELEDSPMVVEAAPGFDPALEQTLGNALQVAASAAQTQAELDEPLQFVVSEIARLVAARQKLPGGEGSALPTELAGLNERWADLLGDASGRAPAFPEAGEALGRALVIGDAAPGLDDSASALLAHIGSLVRLGMAVEFVAAEHRPGLVAHIAAVEALGVTYHRPPLSPSVEEVLRRNRGLYDVVLVHRITNFEKYAALARFYCPLARIVYSVDNLYFVRMLRRAALQQWPVGIQKGEALRLREMMAAWGANAVITSSAFEAELLRKSVPQGNVHVVGWPAEPRPRGMAFAERGGVGFVGDYQVHADYDAAAWLVEVLMPAVWALDPSIPCLLGGCNMPEALRTLSRDGISVVEQAPGPVSGFDAIFDRVRLTVAAQRAGAGLNAGVMAGLAAGIPCVGTSIAFEGFVLPEDLRRGISDDVTALAATICRLHEDPAENAAFVEAGLRFIDEQYSAATTDHRMQAVIGAELHGGMARAPNAEMAVAAQ